MGVSSLLSSFDTAHAEHGTIKAWIKKKDRETTRVPSGVLPEVDRSARGEGDNGVRAWNMNWGPRREESERRGEVEGAWG